MKHSKTDEHNEEHQAGKIRFNVYQRNLCTLNYMDLVRRNCYEHVQSLKQQVDPGRQYPQPSSRKAELDTFDREYSL